MDSDDDLKKFEEDDSIRPIDTGSDTPSLPDVEDVMPIFPKEEDEQEPLSTSTDKVPEMPDAASEDAKAGIFDDSLNFLEKGDYKDLREKDPTINRIVVGVGWEQRSMEEEKIDIDLTCFLLNNDGETRKNEDFIYYNHESSLDGAVKHTGDNRTGAGEGDDEKLFIDLNGVPFDILKVMLVMSIYDEDQKGLTFGMVRDLYMRIVNQDDEEELYRFVAPEDEVRGANAYRALCLVREGPKWFVEAVGKPTKGRLNEIASDYGIIVQEDTG